LLGVAEAAGVAAALRAANGLPDFPSEPEAHPVSAIVATSVSAANGTSLLLGNDDLRVGDGFCGLVRVTRLYSVQSSR